MNDTNHGADRAPENQEGEKDAKLTKAERKRERRAEKERQREAEEKRKEQSKKTRKLVGVAVVVLIVGGLWFMGAGDNGAGGEQQGGESSDGAAVSFRDDDWVKGNADARVTLVEYGDFQCPACASWHPVISQLAEDLGDDIRIVYRHYPIERAHPHAQEAAIAAEAAGRQGKFWEMHDLLFERQGDWSGERSPTEIFEGYAEELELDAEQFKRDVKDKALDKKVDGHRKEGTRAGVRSTPSFFLNGELMDGFESFEQFQTLIQEEVDREVAG